MCSTTLSSGITAQPRGLIVYADSLRACLFRFRTVHSLFDIGCKIVKGFLDVDVVLRRDFQERYSQFVGQLLTLLRCYSSLLFPVAFVPNKDLVDTLASMLFDVREPCSDVCDLTWVSDRCMGESR